MASAPTINPPNTPIAGSLVCAPEWWRYFLQVNQVTAGLAAGVITTAPNSGLAGGGNVADGLSLSIATNGVTNAMFRQSVGTSVVGRAFGSSGNVADITADANEHVLSRESNQLAFRSFINGVSIGPTTAAPLVRTDTLELTDNASASTASVTHSIPIETGSGTMYILLSSTP